MSSLAPKKSPNIFDQIYQILACLNVLITYGKLSKQKIVVPVDSVTGLLPLFVDFSNHVSFERICFFLVHCFFYDLAQNRINDQFKAVVHSQLNFTGFPEFLSDLDNAS